MLKTHTSLELVIILLIGVLIGGTGYYLITNTQKSKVNTVSPTKIVSRKLTSADFVGRSGGCANILVYRYSELGGISVKVDYENFKSSSKPITFNLATDPTAEVTYAEGENLYGTIPELFCNDFVDPNAAKPKVWTAYSGTITVTNMGYTQKTGSIMDPYEVNVVIKDVYFRDENGKNEIYLDVLKLEMVTVGWFPG